MNKHYIDAQIKETTKHSISNNLYEIACNNNIVILEFDLGESTNGLYLYLEKTRLILLNTNMSESHKKIVLAHEIGHAILHTKVNCAFIKKYTHISTNTFEVEANYFAAKLLYHLDILTDDNLCIYSKEITDLDIGFIDAIKNTMR